MIVDHAKAQMHIRNCWIAGLVSGGVTLLVALAAALGFSFMGFSTWNLLDAGLMLGLSYGIYRNSRICAILLFAYFAASKAIMWVQFRNIAGLPLALVFGYFFFMGILGTFACHSVNKVQPSA
jgi:hypothetical protein